MSVERARGFTLIEVLVVVAIIGLAAGIAANALRTTNNRAVTKNALEGLRGRLEVARSLAMAAGPRLGTPQFQNCVNAVGPPGSFLAISITPAGNNYAVPLRLAYAGGGVAPGQFITSTCGNFDIGSDPEGRAFSAVTVNGGNAAVLFAFTATGRLDTSAGLTPGPIFIRIEQPGAPASEIVRAPGIRILPSGVICGSTDATGAGSGCDEDAPP